MTKTVGDNIRAGLIAAIEAIDPRTRGPAFRCVARADGSRPDLAHHTGQSRAFELVTTAAPVDGGMAEAGPSYWVETVEVRVLYPHGSPGDQELLQRQVTADVRDIARAVCSPAWWQPIVGLDYARTAAARLETDAGVNPAWLISVPVTVYYWEV